MKYRNVISKKLGLIGAGMGLVLFALFGLLQGSVIGGAIGLDIVGGIYSTAASPTLLARVIIGGSMLAGVVISGVMFVVGCGSVMAGVGYALGWMIEPKEAKDLAGAGNK
jgi:hypothetical protein